ncbi:hypothetical protein L2E82_04181 [Cichorium intybus]|uniref:Uncharacterized protein n=1 Tax=Cichorium intybus TaxID=13427 RepID=A0ACB9H521_CICIN|nr:hypothetical protein L2E82_04181 [Cichorium intybus]
MSLSNFLFSSLISFFTSFFQSALAPTAAAVPTVFLEYKLAMNPHIPVVGNVMQPIAFSVVRNVKVEQDYRKDDRYIPADLVVDDTMVLFWEVPDLRSTVAVVLVAPIPRLLRHIPHLSLDNGIVAEEVVDSVSVV